MSAKHPPSAGSRVARADLLDGTRGCGQLSRAGPGLHREHDRKHRLARVRHRRQRGPTRRGSTRVARGLPRRISHRRRSGGDDGGSSPQHVARTLGIEIGLLLGAAIVAATADVQPATFSGDVVIAMLALGMGVRNATVRRLAVPDLTTTVLTMSLTVLAADSRLAGGSGKGSVRSLRADE
jgi:hypothetical protein